MRNVVELSNVVNYGPGEVEKPLMSQIENLLHEKIIHSIRSDASKMVAIQVGSDADPIVWETLLIEKDGTIVNDGQVHLASNEKAVLRKTITSEHLLEIAMMHDFVEWQPGFPGDLENEQSLTMLDKLHAMEESLSEATTQKADIEKQLKEAQKKIQSSRTVKTRGQSTRNISMEEVEQRIRSTAEAIAERTPSHTQKIIANQVELSAGYYQEVGTQSHESFRLSLWLATAGGVIFLLTISATVLISFYRGNTTLLFIIGTCATTITELLAALNRFYNQASQQLAAFQTYLDRINRSSICYSMISEEEFEKKTQQQQDVIKKIVEALLDEKKK